MLSSTDISVQEPQGEAAELQAEAAAAGSGPEARTSLMGGRIARAAIILMAGTILSRVLGLGRESTIAALFGGGAKVDAFTIANNVVTIVYDLLLSGAVSAALVPVFSEYAASEERRAEFGRVVSTVMTIAALFLGVSIGVLELFAHPLATFMCADYTPETCTEAFVMVQWVLPAVLFMGLSGVVMAAHYALRRFIYPAFTAALFNVAIIFCAFSLSRWFDVRSLAIGLVLGALAMLVLQLPGLRDVPLRPTIDLSHPAVRRIMKLYAPVALSVVVSSIALTIDRNLASQTGQGSIAAMRFATTLIQFALGIVAAAISLASLPSLSQHFSTGNSEAFKRTLASGLRLVTVLVLPAAAGLMALSVPMVGLFFRHGQFTADDQARTVLALMIYAPGLPFSAIDQVLLFAFYARKNTLTPALIGIAQFGVYLAVALGSYRTWGMPGLVLANSLQLAFHATVTGLLLFRTLGSEGGMKGYGIGETVLKAGAASVAVGAASFGIWWLLQAPLKAQSLGNQVVLLGVPALVGGALYAGLAWAMKLPELQMIASKVTGRLRLRMGAKSG